MTFPSDMRDGPAAGLSEIEGLLAKGELDEAKASFEKALALTSQEQRRRFLRRRLAEIK